MPVGIMINDFEIEAVNAAFPEGHEDRPKIENNLLMFEPRKALRIITGLQNFDGDEDVANTGVRFSLRLAELVGRSYRHIAFDGPAAPSPSDQPDLFDEPVAEDQDPGDEEE